MARATFTVSLGVVSASFTDIELQSLKARFNRGVLYRGPCLILNRDTGLALDAGTRTRSGDHTVLWQAHGAPWQQWRLRAVGGGVVEIVSESSGLLLTTMARGFEWGEVWLDRKSHPDWSRRWRLAPTDDRSAFLVQNADSGYALDAGEAAENGRDPHLWPEGHWAAWQQWMIVRLPLT